MSVSSTTVGWDDDPLVAAWPGLSQLPGDLAADACVVGLGASGLAAVEHLADRGLSVIGVDAGRVAASAAGRNGGFLIAGPALFFHDAVAQWGTAALDLYRATLAELDRLTDLLGPTVIRRAGSIRLAGLPGDPSSADESADRVVELADCRAQAVALRAHGIAADDYDGPLGRGIHLPDDAATNPAVRAIALAHRLAERAALYEHTPVSRVVAGRVRTERGTITAPVIVVAVDGRLESLVPSVSGRVRSVRLQMASTEPVPALLPCPVYCRWGLDYLQQLPDGRLFLGGGRDVGMSAGDEEDGDGPTPAVQRYLDDVVGRVAPASTRVTHRWAAPVGYTPDSRPLCVQVDDGVAAVGGYTGHGNLVGPVVARAAVDHLLDGTPPPAWAAP